MRLLDVSIRNFRLLERARMALTLDDPTTILVGPNNSGKTSAMEAIRDLTGYKRDRRKLSAFDFSQRQIERIRRISKRFDCIDPDSDDAIERRERLLSRLPRIRLELTFSYEDRPTDLNIVQPLIMSLAEDQQKVRVRIEFAVSNAAQLARDFATRRKPETTSLFDWLIEHLHTYFDYSVYKLSLDGRTTVRLDDDSILNRIIRIDIVPAQRHVDDNDDARSARLSALLHTHFTSYVKDELPEDFQAIEDAIAESADGLAERYDRVFARLKQRLTGFGYPQGNAKPDLRIRAEMSSETVYRDSTRVYYATQGASVDAEPLELPEKYNGLGYKNLIYMVLKLESFRAALESVPGEQPGVHLIGIEEPEAHLHPQMQAVFVSEISRILSAPEEAGAAAEGETDAGGLGQEGPNYTGQALLSTHSSHVIAHSGFSPIRYFRKRRGRVDIRDLSEIGAVLLKANDGDKDAAKAALEFLKRYIKLTHCDLMFADRSILVEGQVERLLLPAMIEKIASTEGYEALARSYVTILEIGGAYAHKIAPLIDFLGIPTLVITDLDSVDATGTKCPVADGKRTTNGVIKYWMSGKNWAEVRAADDHQKIKKNVRIAYQVDEAGQCGRSFEEAFLYANATWISANITSLVSVASILPNTAPEIVASAYPVSEKIAKVDFALDLISTPGWQVPTYIAGGLRWLANAGGGE